MRNLAAIFVAALAGFFGGEPAFAQLQLPGAAPPAQGGERSPGPATGVAVRAPVEASLLGRDLRQNGVHGLISFRKQGAELAIVRLVFSGERLSNRREACRVEVDGGPFTAIPQGRFEGLNRYAVNIPACPFTFVVLDAAILATTADGGVVAQGSSQAAAATPARADNRAGAIAGMCAFSHADCVVHVGGVWGPSGASVPAAEVQQILRRRTAAEKNALANYRALISQAGKDRQKVRAIAAEQASFSSRRAEQCYDYDGEETHGFCSARVTEARAVALRAQLNPSVFEAENSAPERRPATSQPRYQPRSQPQAQQQPGGAPMSLGGAR